LGGNPFKSYNGFAKAFCHDTGPVGNPGFLDIFCINDTNDPNGLVAGKVNLNTRQAPVLQAIFGRCL
jgi:hypothetical protein